MATRTISTKLAIEGETQYKQAIASCNSELSTLKSDLKLVESEFRNNANSMEALTAKGSALQAVFDKQLEKVTTLEAALLNAKNAVDVYAEKQSDLKSKLEVSNQAIGALDDAAKKSGTQWAEYAQEIQKSETALNALKQKSGDTSAKQAELEAAISKARAEMEKLETSTNGAARQAGELIQKNNQLNAELDKNDANLAAAERGVSSWQKQLNNAKIELNGLDDKIRENDQYLREAEASADGCATSIDQYGKVVKEAGKSSEEFAEGTQQSKLGIEQLAAALAAAGVAKTVKEITDELMSCAGAAGTFETALAKLSTLMVPYSMDYIKAELMDLSNETNVAVTALTEAAYQARSAGVDAANVVDFVATATKTSVAGFTDSATAVDVLTTAINAYKLEGSDAERVASMLVKTQDEGKTSVGELAQNMGRIIPVAAAYNVSLEDLTTSYALLTKSGTNTRIATTNLSAMLTELAKDGSTVADVLQQQTGKSFSELTASGQNLGEIMSILSDSVDGDATAFSNLWSSTTAGQAALSLLNSGAEEFNRTLLVMENSSGAVDRNFQIMADTTEFAQQRMANAANNLRIAIGDQLNPALEKLYDAGADAFTWAADFVNENPEVVSALTALTVGMGVLTAGVVLAANAENIMAIATAALNAVMAANPAFLVAAGVTALVTAIGTYILATGSADEETKAFVQSLKDTKAAYDDLMSSIGEEQTSVRSMADALAGLLGIEEKSASQKKEIKELVDRLNDAIPDLGLAYDEEKGALIDLTAAELDAKITRAQAAEEHEAQVSRLAELRTEQADITSRLEDATEQLAEAEALAATEEARNVTWIEQQNGVTNRYEGTVARLRCAVDELTAAEADNAAQIAELETATDAYAEGQGAAAQRLQEAQDAVDELTARMTELQASYDASYQAAYDSIEGQLGLFHEMDGEAKQSIDDLIGALQSQVEYMDNYAANIQKAMEMGVDEGLVRKLSDGSEASAQILDAIVKGGEDDILKLNEAFANVEKGKDDFSDTVAQMETDFDKKMDEFVKDVDDAREDLAKAEKEWLEVGMNDAQALIDGFLSKKDELTGAYAMMGNAALAAYKAAVDQHSPSREFVKAANYDVQGLIDGAEAKKAELAAAYENLAEMALKGYATGVIENLDMVSQALDELDAAFKNFSSYYDAKAEVGNLEYELWERTEGKWASDVDKYAKKLEVLAAQQEDQSAVVAAAEEAYRAVVEQYGEASEESYKYQKTLLEEKLAYEDLADAIRDATNAKHEAFIAQERQRFSTPLPYTDPYAASAALGSTLLLPSGQDFSAAYDQVSQGALTAQAMHLPSSLEDPQTGGALERQMESFTAGVVNAISGAANSGERPIIITRVMVPDGRMLAEVTFDDLVDYGDSNGTPIVNSRR